MVLSVDELRRIAGIQQVPGTSISAGPRSAGSAGPTPPSVGAGVESRRPTSSPSFEAALSGLPTIEREEPSGGGGDSGGIFSQVKGLGSTIVGGVLTPLDKLAVPGRAVVAGLENAARALPDPIEHSIDALINNSPRALAGDGILGQIDEEREDIGSWWDRANDSTYGYGTASKETGNKWLDRINGLAGDIALDPLTYLTAGSTKAAGAGARTRYQAKAAEVFGPDKADDVINRLSKGPSFLDASERAALGLDEAGIRFAGAKLPGTAGVADAIGQATGTVRHSVVKSRPWQKISRAPEGLEEAHAVLKGASTSMTPTEAATVVAWHGQYNAVRNTARNKYGRQFQETLVKLDEDQRRALTHATEAGEVSDLRPIQRDILAEAKAAGVNIGDVGDNYMTHMWSDKARETLTGNSQIAQDLRRYISVDPTEVSGAASRRSIKAGDVLEVGGKKIELKTGTIAEINEKLTKAFPDMVPDGRWLEDDAAKLVSAYIENVSGDIAAVQAFEHILGMKAQVGANLDDVSSEMLDEVARKTSDPTRRKQLADELKARKAQYDVDAQAGKERAAELQTRLTGWMDERMDELGIVLDDVRGELRTQNATSQGLHKQAQAAARKLNRTRKSLTRELNQVDDMIAAQQRRVNDAPLSGGGVPTAEMLELHRLQDQVRPAVQEKLQAVVQFGEELESATTLSRRMLDNVDDPDFVDAVGSAFDEVTESKAALAASRAEADRLAAEATKVQKAQQEVAQAKLRLSELPDGVQGDVATHLDEIEQAVAQAAGDPDLLPMVDDLMDYEDMLMKLSDEHDGIRATTSLLAAAKEGSLDDIFKYELETGWKRIAEGLTEGDVVVRKQVADALENVRVAVDDGEFWKTVDSLTGVFKAYATASPGFHVRNAISATFMNLADGVKPSHMKRAASEWRKMAKDPERYLQLIEVEDPELFKAFQATFGSGAGGSFGAGELGGDVLGRARTGPNRLATAANRVADTKVTRASRRVGEPVEGVVRLSVALDSLARGDEMLDAVSRISRLQFNYSELSKLDRVAKRAIPFWIFASRNLPLQVQQMWMKPGAYLAADKVAKNFNAAREGDVLPPWLEDRGGFVIGHSGDTAISLAPDLAHKSLFEDAGMFDVTDPTGVLSNLNPLLTGPVEAFTNHNLFTGNPVSRESGTQGEVERAEHAAQQILPFLATIERLTGVNLSGSEDQGVNGEKVANWLGAPVRTHSPSQQDFYRWLQSQEGNG